MALKRSAVRFRLAPPVFFPGSRLLPRDERHHHRCEASGSCATAHMLRIRQFPAFMRAQIGGAVDTAAIIALGAMARDRDETHPHGVARLRMLDRRHGGVANLVAAIFKGYRASGARNALKARSN